MTCDASTVVSGLFASLSCFSSILEVATIVKVLPAPDDMGQQRVIGLAGCVTPGAINWTAALAGQS